MRSRSLSGKPARLLKTALTDAWERPGAPDPLSMPLQFLATSEASQRIGRAARSQDSRARELVGTPVGQIVGKMSHVRPAREVIYEMVEEYLETMDRLTRLLERSEEA